MPPQNEKSSLLESKGSTSSTPVNDGEPKSKDGSKIASARFAYESGNIDASRRYHESKTTAALNPEHTDEEPWHQSVGGYLQPVIFGGLDGILTSFAIVSGAVGGCLPITTILILGFSNIFADALRYEDRFFPVSH